MDNSRTPQRAPDDCRMPADLGAEQEREEGGREPRAQVRPEPADAAIVRQLERHRVARPQRADLEVPDQYPSVAVADLLAPAQVAQVE